ncbi:MAG: ribosomal-processing cysteine protease Prp [Eubacteriales bacterium]|nr:ribosomal-processing cysteine protease Prp [Eubacteriales bacterium]HBR31166.1 hypothetical protein [Clostridiales bacterium]
MTKAVFWIENGEYIGFEISGHTGNNIIGKDIVCAAISAMTMLTVNTICDVYKQRANTSIDDSRASVSFKLKSRNKGSLGLIRGFYNELAALKEDYPENIDIRAEEILRKGVE